MADADNDWSPEEKLEAIEQTFKEDVIESGHTEEIRNEERGCGHLQHNAAYVRSDVTHPLFSGGDVPRFVTLEEPVEYREYGDRGAIIPGWKAFPGIAFGEAYVNEGHSTSPERAITDHHERLGQRLGFGGGDHYGEIVAARAHDLLMSVGKSNWGTPEAFIEECERMGLNLKIPASPSREPPVINPMRTRCWVIHPNGAGEGRAAIIGYSVLSRTIYTTGEAATADDPDIPTYAEEWAETGRINLATPGEEIPARAEAEQPDANIGDFAEGEGDE